MTYQLPADTDIAGQYDISETEAARICDDVSSHAGFIEVWENDGWWLDSVADVGEARGTTLPLSMIHAVLTSAAGAKMRALGPYLLGTVAGIAFYEHPVEGDEAPMLALAKGVWYATYCYELPDMLDLI